MPDMKTPLCPPNRPESSLRRRAAQACLLMLTIWGLAVAAPSGVRQVAGQTLAILGLAPQPASGMLGKRMPAHQLKADMRSVFHALEYVLEPETSLTGAPPHDVG